MTLGVCYLWNYTFNETEILHEWYVDDEVFSPISFNDVRFIQEEVIDVFQN